MDFKEKIFNFLGLGSINCFECNKLHIYHDRKNVICCDDNFYYSIRFAGHQHLIKYKNYSFFYVVDENKMFFVDYLKKPIQPRVIQPGVIQPRIYFFDSLFYEASIECNSEKEFHEKSKTYIDNLIFI